MRKLFPIAALCAAILNSPAHAGEADVLEVDISRSNSGTYRLNVTVKHADTGWKHYADAWEVALPNGEVLATRVLQHPHVGEQPFTRSLRGVKIPASTQEVIVRAHDLEHGYGGKEIRVQVPR